MMLIGIRSVCDIMGRSSNAQSLLPPTSKKIYKIRHIRDYYIYRPLARKRKTTFCLGGVLHSFSVLV